MGGFLSKYPELDVSTVTDDYDYIIVGMLFNLDAGQVLTSSRWGNVGMRTGKPTERVWQIPRAAG